MSSATSIERLRRQSEEPGPPGEYGSAAARAARENAFRPWHFFVLVSLLAATAAVVMARQPSPEHLVLMSVAIGAAGICGAALYRTLAPLVREERSATPVLSSRSRAALERDKALVLRTIKELEFDRAMGKMSSADFDEMATRLRARAIALMKALDEPTPDYRARIEHDLSSRLPVSASAPETGVCACGTRNDADARFCKACGVRLNTAGPTE